MTVFILLVFLFTCYPVMRLMLGAEDARTPTTGYLPQAYPGQPRGVGIDAGSRDGPAWGALDDRQLTRLLIDSAPRTISE